MTSISVRQSTGMVTLFAFAAGLAVANIYYAQPLLSAIATEFRIGSGTATLIVTLTTIGYTAGLALLVPLGDMVSRRRLLVGLLLVVGVAQAVSAVVPSFAFLAVLSVPLAVCAVGAPILVSFAATLASTSDRGQVTGRVMTGVLLGVLLARTGGGLIAQVTGTWRSVYGVAAVLMVGLAVVLYRVLPEVAPIERIRYPALLRSVFAVVREEPALRLRCSYGFLCFASFSAFWTTLAFLLAQPPYSYGEGVIGLFGLAGAVGALAARPAGRLVDRNRERLTSGLLLGGIVLSWGVVAVQNGHSLAALLVGVLVLDLGVQGMQVTNLAVIYRTRPEARSRITMAYMTTYFLGGVAGSAAAGAAYPVAGWLGVCAVGGGLAVLALLIWGVEQVVQRGRTR
ncbi:MFS transporter [Actinocrispum wychmicini]|uniref:Putative MFS family arabinose efflux permease n=1 Tax=Actinocrispum wychmicini TaxID=1213861 RepID=A0A4R2JXY4_9PSEU|nr:MFS transporter [Actinocrispum wychmicini]TCO62288.1 putative MFS family arabinose efflux permease [Actinocrispum wychmicini]